MNDVDAKVDDRNERGPAGSRDEEERTTSQPLKDKYAPDGFATDALDETHMLLAYAASSGINIDPDVSEAIARARAANERQNWNADIEAKFWPAKSKLSLSVKPVTVDTLAAGKFGAAAIATRRYFRSTVILAAIIVPISIVMFINTAISNDVGNLLKENDAAAIALHEQLVNYQSALKQAARTTDDRANQNGTAANLPDVSQALLSPNLVEKLAQFARVSRQLFAESRVLNFFIPHTAELPPWATAKKGEKEDPRRANLELDVRAGDPTRDPEGKALYPSITGQGSPIRDMSGPSGENSVIGVFYFVRRPTERETRVHARIAHRCGQLRLQRSAIIATNWERRSPCATRYFR
jgi:hypothetical protein